MRPKNDHLIPWQQIALASLDSAYPPPVFKDTWNSRRVLLTPALRMVFLVKYGDFI